MKILARIHAQRGRVLFAAERWDDAASAYERALARDARPADWHYRLGLARKRMEQWQQAADAFEAAVTLDGSTAEWHYQLGLAHERLGHWHKAETAYAAAVARDDTRAEWHYLLGRVRERTGRWETAASAYEAALALALVGALAEDGIARACGKARDAATSEGGLPGSIAKTPQLTVCFVPAPSPTKDLASTRIRCRFMSDALNEHFAHQLSAQVGLTENADVIVISQLCSASTLLKAAVAKAKGARVIYDCCDPYADYEGGLYGIHAARRFWDLVALADALTVPTDALASLLRNRGVEKPIVVLPDTIDYREQLDPRLVPATQSVVWFGSTGRGNYDSGAWALRTLKDRWGYAVTLITNPSKISAPADFHVEPWSYDGFVSRLRAHGLALISQDPAASYKSENRFIASIMSGVPAISTGSESIARLMAESGFPEMNVTNDRELDCAIERLSDAAYRVNYVARMQAIVAERFGPAQITRQFVEEVLADKPAKLKQVR